MIDLEGPNIPPDREGNRHSMTYNCCLCRSLLADRAPKCNATEARRMFARGILRSGTIPSWLRSDRGPEFKNREASFAKVVVFAFCFQCEIGLTAFLLRKCFSRNWLFVEIGGITSRKWPLSKDVFFAGPVLVAPRSAAGHGAVSRVAK